MLQNNIPEEFGSVVHTPHGDIDVASSVVAVDEVVATHKSNLAPLWLVFPENIFNTQNIVCISKASNKKVEVHTRDGLSWAIPVSDMNRTWSALQKVFSEGVPAGE